MKQVKTIRNLLLLLGCLLCPVLGEQSYFDSRLSLPDFPGFEIFVQVQADDRVKSLPKKEARWELQGKPTANTSRYLLVAPSKELWITISLHHTPYGGKESLSGEKFEKKYLPLLQSGGMTLVGSKDVKSAQAGSFKYFLIKSEQMKGYATRLLYIPAADTKFLGDNRAFTIGVTSANSSAAAAEKIVEKILKHTKVTAK